MRFRYFWLIWGQIDIDLEQMMKKMKAKRSRWYWSHFWRGNWRCGRHSCRWTCCWKPEASRGIGKRCSWNFRWTPCTPPESPCLEPRSCRSEIAAPSFFLSLFIKNSNPNPNPKQINCRIWKETLRERKKKWFGVIIISCFCCETTYI